MPASRFTRREERRLWAGLIAAEAAWLGGIAVMIALLLAALLA